MPGLDMLYGDFRDDYSVSIADNYKKTEGNGGSVMESIISGAKKEIVSVSIDKGSRTYQKKKCKQMRGTKTPMGVAGPPFSLLSIYSWGSLTDETINECRDLDV